jgi:hypothetical protein
MIYHAKAKVNWIVWLAAGLGVFIFIAIYGVQVLVPTNADWLLTGGDLSQHYIGWEFFRQSDWTFPIGVASDLAYPHGIAITFMDSIPLFAIPFKLIGPMLPEHFQYFGWWGLFSFAAVAALSARIVQRWTKDPFIAIATALFFCVSPVVLQRMFGHTALAGHWIILMGIWAIVWGSRWSSSKRTIVWSIILMLSVLIHPYFLIMNVLLMALSVAINYQGKWKQTAIESIAPIIDAAIMTWIIGGFSITEVASRTLGMAGYDLVSPIAPVGWSAFYGSNFTSHPETFGYYGLGGFLLIAVALVISIRKRVNLMVVVKRHRNKLIITALILVAMLLFALSPKLRFAGTVLFEYHLPAAIEKVWSVFRVTARVAWPLFYLIMFVGVYVIVRHIPNKSYVRGLIILVCAVQMLDILGSSQLHMRHERISHVGDARYVSVLTDSRWEEIAKGREHIIYLAGLYENDFIAIAQYAINHKMTLNTGYFARKPTRAIEATIEHAKIAVKEGKIDSKTIYIARDPYTVATNLKSQIIDGYSIVVK